MLHSCGADPFGCYRLNTMLRPSSQQVNGLRRNPEVVQRSSRKCTRADQVIHTGIHNFSTVRAVNETSAGAGTHERRRTDAPSTELTEERDRLRDEVGQPARSDSAESARGGPGGGDGEDRSSRDSRAIDGT